MLLLHALQRGGVLAAGERTAGRSRVVAHGAVDAEQVAAAGDVHVLVVHVQVLVLGDGRAGAERGDVGGELRRLLVVELVRLDLGLRAVHLHRHAAGAHLEVDGGGADTDQGRTGGTPRGTRAVARGAVRVEELLALGDVISRGGRGDLRGRLRLVHGARDGVQSAGHQESQQEERQPHQGMASVLRKCLHGGFLSFSSRAGRSCCRPGPEVGAVSGGRLTSGSRR
ncbi:Uncharacterised protein [Streptococcus pneumoniae]|nr:Uncharacterised protein [Streptococcus pneumoniae]